jgi:hypothetical protein
MFMANHFVPEVYLQMPRPRLTAYSCLPNKGIPRPDQQQISLRKHGSDTHNRAGGTQDDLIILFLLPHGNSPGQIGRFESWDIDFGMKTPSTECTGASSNQLGGDLLDVLTAHSSQPV